MYFYPRVYNCIILYHRPDHRSRGGGGGGCGGGGGRREINDVVRVGEVTKRKITRSPY